jgi:hypothetical protein
MQAMRAFPVAAMVAAVLGLAAFSAGPAEARSGGHHHHHHHGHHHHHDGGHHHRHHGGPHFRFFHPHRFRISPFVLQVPSGSTACMSNWEVRQALEDEGYSGVRIVASLGSTTRADAALGGWNYAIRFDRCSGSIESTVRLGHR